MGLETDTSKFKIGDGSTAWTSLAYGLGDHGNLTGLGDDDHTQYTKHSLATAVSDFLVASGAGAFVKKTLAEVKTILGLAGTVGGNVPASAAADDVMVGDSTTGNWIKKTIAEFKAILGVSEWITPTFDAGDFTASGSMTWTVEAGDVAVYRYKMLSADTMVLQWSISTTTVGGTPSYALRIKIPNGKTAAGVQDVLSYGSDNGTTMVNLVEVSNGVTYIEIFTTVAAANWSASTNTTFVRGQIILKVS
jgi:hypothetical protein